MGIIDELKAQARGIERELECKLEELEKLHSSLDPENFEVRFDKSPEVLLQQLIDRLLSQFKYITEQMQKSSTTQIEKSLTATYLQSQKSAEKRYLSVKSSIENKRWQQQLLGKHLASNDSSKIDLLIREDKHLDESLEMGKNILAAAQDVRVSMAYQANKLNGTSDKIVRFAETLPGINYLMKRISSRKKVNAAVLGLATAICVCIVIYKIF